MYQGLRMVGGLLVLLGLVFPVGVWVWVDSLGSGAAATYQPVISEEGADQLAKAFGGDSAGMREAIRLDREWHGKRNQGLQSYQVVSLFGMGMIDLAIIGLGLGLRAIADMADKLARVGPKKPA